MGALRKVIVCFPEQNVSPSFTICVIESTSKLKNCFIMPAVFWLHTIFTSG